MSAVGTCAVCDRRVRLAHRHVTVARQVERESAGTVEVLDAEVIAYLHLTCADRIGSTVATSAARAER